MWSLLAKFSPLGAFLGNWRGYLFACAVGASVAGWGMYRVMDWYQDSIQNEAWEFSIQRLQDQAAKDKARLLEIDNRLAEIDKDARKWRQRYRNLQRISPEVRAWADVNHPADIGWLLNSTSADLPGNGNP